MTSDITKFLKDFEVETEKEKLFYYAMCSLVAIVERQEKKIEVLDRFFRPMRLESHRD